MYFVFTDTMNNLHTISVFSLPQMERHLQILLPEIKQMQNYGKVYLPEEDRKRCIDMAKERPPQSYNPYI